jgi:hypothetical protein
MRRFIFLVVFLFVIPVTSVRAANYSKYRSIGQGRHVTFKAKVIYYLGSPFIRIKLENGYYSGGHVFYTIKVIYAKAYHYKKEVQNLAKNGSTVQALTDFHEGGYSSHRGEKVRLIHLHDSQFFRSEWTKWQFIQKYPLRGVDLPVTVYYRWRYSSSLNVQLKLQYTGNYDFDLYIAGTVVTTKGHPKVKGLIPFRGKGTHIISNWSLGEIPATRFMQMGNIALNVDVNYTAIRLAEQLAEQHGMLKQCVK